MSEEQSPRLFRISYKISSIVLVLIILMGAISVVSHLMVSDVQRQMKLATIHYSGVERLVASLQTAANKQQFHLERAIRFNLAKKEDQLFGEVESFVGKAELVSREFAFAQRLIVAAEKEAPGEAISFLKDTVGDVEKNYELLYDKQTAFLQKLVEQSAVADDLYEEITTSQSQLSAQLKILRDEVQRFVETANTTVEKDSRRIIYITAIVTAIAILIGAITSFFVVRGIVRPVLRLLGGTREVELGNLDGKIEITTRDEVAELTRSFNRMVGELRLKEKIKSVFGKYVDPRIVNELIETESGQSGREQEMSVFFSDINDFTSLSEKIPPDELVNLLNAYLTQMSDPIKDNLGVIDKFIGDAVMAFWGEPFTPAGKHATLACRTALQQRKLLDTFRSNIPNLVNSRDLSREFDMRIGIATGDALMGSIGSEDSRGYTVVGDTVNVAARLESINKQYGTSIIISERTRELIGEEFETREIDCIRVKGKKEPSHIFELIGEAGSLDEAGRTWRDQFEAAIWAYRQKEFDSALLKLKKCIASRPNDQPTAVYMRRIEIFSEKPEILKDFDGVWTYDRK